MDINVLVDKMLSDKKIEKMVLKALRNDETDYFYEHYAGMIAEQNLYRYCEYAQKHRHARKILMQIVRYCNEQSMSARVFEKLAALPKKDFETCCHALAHCPLSFIQKAMILSRYQTTELIVDLLGYMCTHEQCTYEDIRFVMTYAEEKNLDALNYFVESFDPLTAANGKDKLDVVRSHMADGLKTL